MVVEMVSEAGNSSFYCTLTHRLCFLPWRAASATSLSFLPAAVLLGAHRRILGYLATWLLSLSYTAAVACWGHTEPFAAQLYSPKLQLHPHTSDLLLYHRPLLNQSHTVTQSHCCITVTPSHSHTFVSQSHRHTVTLLYHSHTVTQSHCCITGHLPAPRSLPHSCLCRPPADCCRVARAC